MKLFRIPWLVFALGFGLNPSHGMAAPSKNEGPKTSQGPSTPALPAFDYSFGRPITEDEHTYAWYRKTHAQEAAKRMNIKAEDIADGMDTWHWWVGVDNPGFWRDLAKLTGSKHNYTHLHMDFLRMIMSTPRAERWKTLGLINDPDTVPVDKPDEFGITMDRMKDGTLTWDPEKFGYSSGVIGLMLFKNENFDPKKWDLKKYMDNAASVEPPYRIGMSCAFCHVGFNPMNPPKDPVNPDWANLTSAIGNQYLREGLVFAQGLPTRSLIYQYLDKQEPGTSETSRFPSDFINNPTVINSIFRLNDRLDEARPEKITLQQRDLIKSMYANAKVPLDSKVGALGGTDSEPTLKVPRILTDGSDSLGVVMASVRVYVNEGMMHDQWYSSWPVNPWAFLKSVKRKFTGQEFDLMPTARKDPNSPWMQTERRMPNMATFLSTYDSFPLEKVPGVNVSQDAKLLERGKLAFADNCAHCHSSKVPANLSQDPAIARDQWRHVVLEKDFLDHNYLSDDERHPATVLGTNVQRASGTNAHGGNTWGQMSSQSYKDLRAVKMEMVDLDAQGNHRPLYNPLTGQYDIKWTGPSAYYRTPTLVGIWATAPFLHNNALGTYNPDPSVAARLKTFEESAEMLLWPEKRLGVKSIKVTSEETSLPELFPDIMATPFKGLEKMDLKLLSFPKGTPINLLMSVNPIHAPALVEAYIGGVLNGKPRTELKGLLNRRRDAGMKALTAKLLEVNSCPDFIEDRGHLFGTTMSDDDKKALIEYMKFF